MKRLQARYEKTKDLQADFTQKTTIEGFERPMTSSGKVYIKKPGRLRWNYLEPSAEDIYVKEMMLKYMCRSTSRSWSGNSLTWLRPEAPLELLQGAAKLDASFDAEPTPGKSRGVGGIRLVTLVPKSHEAEAHGTVQRIVVEVFPKTYFIRSLSLYEVSGNVSNFEFSSLQSNIGSG